MPNVARRGAARRRLSWPACGALAFVLLVAAPAARAETTILFADDFDRAGSGAVGNGWVETDHSDTADARVEGGRLRFTSGDDPAQPVVSRRFAAVSGGVLTWRYEFDWNRSGSENTYELRMQLGLSSALRDPALDGTSGAVVDLEWSGDVAHETLTVGGAGERRTVGHLDGEEVLEVTADLDADRLSVDIDPSDGAVEASALPLPANATVDMVRLYVDGLNSRKFSDRAFDDVVISATAPVSAPAPTPTATATPTPAPTATPDPDPEPAAGHALTATGNRFALDGAPFEMWGVRTASATADQEQTDHLIAQLDEYRAHGINAVTVFYQGSRAAAYDPFSRDGRTIDPGHQARMEQIIRAADARGMVVITGIFYQRASLVLEDADAVRQAVRTVTEALRPYRNVIINIANEQNSVNWDDTEHIFDFRDPLRIIELCRIVNQLDPARIVGGGGYDDVKNAVIGASPDVDVLLFDTDSPDDDSARAFDAFVGAGVTGKPVVNVEMLGGWTSQFERGVFSDAVKAEYYEEVAAAASRDGLGLFFHNNPWMQSRPMRYDLAGYGTSADPGIRWYFEAVRSLASG